MRHFDVQLIGGMVLHHGKIAEMKTGEGKTLVATLPVYLNALGGRGVHVITVNDYLAKRDSEWMGQLYRFLGLTVGVIVHDLDDAQRREAYAADVTYGTNNEFGFDYLRDNMKFDLRDCVQRGHNYAIVDEVDSILIDEARTPLIISGASEESTDKYAKVNRIIPKLEKGEEIDGPPGEAATLTGDYVVDEKHKNITVTDEGWEKVEGLLSIGNIADPENWDLKHHVEVAVKAHSLYHRDVEYVVKDGEVIIVDEFTGRLMPGRRWSDGLHQAVEAKENVKIERENQTLATITFQNYFRMYKKLSGMTGTAETEAAEFQKIYNLDVNVVPTNRDMVRKEFPDVVYRTEEEKFRNAAKEIKELQEKGQPVLVGTVSVEKSERLSALLKKMGVKHEVLNAKNHEREAPIVAQAGRKGAITVSTNMAGRGTDILLGGNPEFMAREALRKQAVDPDKLPKEEWAAVMARYKEQTDREHDEVTALGGLHILGTERHDSRRIDNQLRGRAGRQGDPGSSRFYLSLQDDLMRIFGGERMQRLMLRLGMEEDVPIESKLITNRIQKAQEAVEAQNFEARKHLLEYDDVMNKQRETIYNLRRSFLEGRDQKEFVIERADAIADELVETYCPREQHPDQWNTTQFSNEVLNQFGFDPKAAGMDFASLNHETVSAELIDKLHARYEEKETLFGAQTLRWLERHILLDVVDGQWKDHLLTLDHLKEGIGLRGYGQKDPLVEFKKEAFILFDELMNRIDTEAVRFLFLVRPAEPPQNAPPPAQSAAPANPSAPPIPRGLSQFSPEEIERKQRRQQQQMQFQAGAAPVESPKPTRAAAKVGRNDPCPCGSGKKYKKCHGEAA
jgi:preprotein translocase subunit SecA